MVRTNERYAEYQADGDQVDGPKAIQEAANGGGGGGSTVDQTARDAATAANTLAASKYTKPGSGIPESDLSAAVTTKLNAVGSAAVPSFLYASIGKGQSYLNAVNGIPVTKKWVFGTGATSSDSVTTAITNLSQLAIDWQPYAGVDQGNGVYFGTGKRQINKEYQDYLDFNGSTHVMQAGALRLQAVSGAGSNLLGVLAYGNHTGTITINAVGGTTTTPMANLGLDSTKLAALKNNRLVVLFGSLAVVRAIDTVGQTVTLETIVGATGSVGASNFEIIFYNLPYHRITTAVTDASTTISITPALDADVPVGAALQAVSSGDKNDMLRHPVISAIDGPRTTITLDGAANMGIGTMAVTGTHGFIIQPRITSGQICSRATFGPMKPAVRFCATEALVRFTTETNGISVMGAYNNTQKSITRLMKPNRKKGYWPAKWDYAVPVDLDTTGFVGDESDDYEGFSYPHAGGDVFTGNLHAQDWSSDNLTDANMFLYKNTLQLYGVNALATNGTYTNVAIVGGTGTNGFLEQVIIINGVISSYTPTTWSLNSYKAGDIVTATIGGQTFAFIVCPRHDVIQNAHWVDSDMGRGTSPFSDFLRLPTTLWDGQPHYIGKISTRDKTYHYLDRKLVRISNWGPRGPDPWTSIFNVAIGPGQVSNMWYDMLPTDAAEVATYFMDVISYEVREI